MIPPDIAAHIRRLIINPDTRKAGLELYSQYAKPVDRYSPVTGPGGEIIGQRSSLTGKVESYPQATPEAVRTADEMRRNWKTLGFSGPDDPALLAAARQRLAGAGTSG